MTATALPAQHVGPMTLADLSASMSKTRAGTFLTCHYRFFRRYVLGEIRPPSAARAFGSSFDSLANSYYGNKIESGEDLPTGEATEVWRDAFAREAAAVEEWDEDRADYVDSGAALVGEWRETIAAKVEPVAVQKPFAVRFTGEDWTLTGYVDLLERHDGAVRPVDLKTSKRRWDERRAVTSPDAAIYSIGLRHGLGLLGDGFAYHVAVRTKQPVTQVIARTVTDAERTGTLRFLALMRQSIMDAYRSGTWIPNRQANSCSRKWCAWWRECEHEWGPGVPV